MGLRLSVLTLRDLDEVNAVLAASDTQGLALSIPALEWDEFSGTFALTLGVQRSSDLMPPWTPPTNLTAVVTNLTGEIFLEFPPPAGEDVLSYRLYGAPTEP